MHRASSDQVSKAPDPALIVHRQVFDSMIDAYLRRVPSPLLGKNGHNRVDVAFAIRGSGLDAAPRKRKQQRSKML